jgi:hypothetical protein
MNLHSIIADYHSGKPIRIWTGESCLEPGQQAAAVLWFTSSNSKTGPMHQLSFYNVYPDDHPYGEHVGAGCLLCPASEFCYVLAGPDGRFQEIKRRQSWVDSLPVVPSRYWSRLINHPVRVGKYGDSACMPYNEFRKLSKHFTRGHTGYTHFWRVCDQRLRNYLMASVESLDAAKLAVSMGWKYYLIQPVDNIKSPCPELREFLGQNNVSDCVVCPHYFNQSQCYECRLCDGQKRLSIIAPVHGALRGRFNS